MDIQQRRPQRRGEQPFDQRLLLFALLAISFLMLTSQTRPPVDDSDEGRQVAADEAPPVEQNLAEPPAPLENLPEEPAAQAQRLPLGSANPAGGYRMLMTIDNVGAGVERIELSSDDYRDLENRSGYLGDLALSDAPTGGALVNFVGPGTPAAEAGLQVGDVIFDAKLSAGDRDASGDSGVASAAELERVLADSKPRQSISLKIRRAAGELTLRTPLRRQPLDLIRPEIENVVLHTPDPPEDFESVASFLVRLTSVAGRRADDPLVAEANRQLVEEAWTIDEQDAESATLRMRLPELGIEVLKEFTVATTPEAEREERAHASYHFDLAVEVRNLRSEPQAVAYELTGPNGLPIEGFWYSNKIGHGSGSFFGNWGSFGMRDLIVRFAGDRLLQFAAKSVSEGDVPPMGQGRPLAFAGIDSQYFASIIIPMKETLATVRTAEVRGDLPTTKLATSKEGGRADPRWQNTSLVLQREIVTLGATGDESGSVADQYRVFAGPKLPELLDQYAPNDDQSHTLADVPYYGWFGFAAKPMLSLLHFFYGIVGNYGLAIVLLTVCVRGAMYPISRQSALNMQKMQMLKPELDRLTEKYGEDMQKRAAAQQELFRKHNYNPAAGCLPMFLQLPIFMGLYRALAVDVELRQQPLFTDAIRFCSNLAAPDMFLEWSAYMPLWMNNGQGMFAFGPYFNLLPLATCGLFLLQQQMFMPEPTNEQAALQQKMMKYMMLFMGLLFFKVPSGLCIYFIASSLWGIAERKMLPKPTNMPVPDAPTPTASSPAKKTATAGEVAALRKKAKKAKTKGKRKK